MLIVFDKDVSFEGQEYKELDLGLENLTGKELIEAAKEVRVLGDVSPIPELSKTYLAVIAAKAAKVPFELVTSLPAREFSRVTLTVQSFLFE